MKKILMLSGIFLCLKVCTAQDSSTTLLRLPAQLYEHVSGGSQKAAEKMLKQQEKMLRKAQDSEEKIYDKLKKVDSAKAASFYAGVIVKYQSLQKKLSDPASLAEAGKAGQYIPRIDSLKTMLKFLAPLAKSKEDVEKALTNIDILKGRLAHADDIKSFLAEREAALKNITQLFTKLPDGLNKNISRYSKEFYYYNERMKGFKEDLKDPQKIEQTALLLLNKIPAFKAFWQQNSELASLFGSPSGAVASVAGLQTRQSLMQELQQRFGASGINPQQLVQQNLASAQNELSQLKAKANDLLQGGAGNGDASMPGFKPNGQRVKPFLKRLEYGFNLQTGSKPVRNLPDYPAVNDLAVSLGYKLSDRFVAGIGVAYKFGLGKDWKHISYSHEGIGLRSYVDWKISDPRKGLKVLFGNWWVSGGYEVNYWKYFRDLTALKSIEWQRSALIGISKKIHYRQKSVKAQILFDLLNQQSHALPFVFRVGFLM